MLAYYATKVHKKVKNLIRLSRIISLILHIMEILTFEGIMLIGSVLLIAGVLIGKSSYRVGLPLLLIFLLVGMG